MSHGPEKSVWKAGQAGELSFWMKWPGIYPIEFAARKDPNRRLEPAVDRHLAGRNSARILEIGAGPISGLGRVSRHGCKVEWCFTDPLADRFDPFYDAWRYHPPEAVLPLAGEDLADALLGKEFDVVYANNAIDHGWDPYLTCESIPGLLTPGGVAILRHILRCGKRNGFRGLHQWDFAVVAGGLVVDGPGPRSAPHWQRRSITWPSPEVSTAMECGEIYITVVYKKE